MRPGALEAGVDLDPHTGLPKGFSGKITFQEPDAEGAARGISSVEALLANADRALRKSGYVVWLLLDRLDVAFAESQELEHNSLRALFKVYLDLLALSSLRLKIFLRTDIWNRITREGFREASHITRHMTIDWNRGSLLNLVARRSAQNEGLLSYYSTTREGVLESGGTQESFFYQMCPEQVDLGPNKPGTLDWMLSRTRDGSGKNAPRELIHFLNSLRSEQIHRLEIGDPEPENGRLFVRSTFKLALPEVSKVRLEQTLYAEFPAYREHLEKLRSEKTSQSAASLAAIWKIDEAEALRVGRELVEVGFFEQRGAKEAPEFWVPFLYRDALDLVQDSAD